MGSYQLGFYIHHHGSGHIMRALSIVAEFKDIEVTFLGSNLKPYAQLIPTQINCIHLPNDIPHEGERFDEAYESCKNFHYAPLNISGIRKRNEILVGYFSDHSRLLFIVDTSPEIVALARLCGVPAIVFQQHGERNDLVHHLAYDSAIKIIAPFSKDIAPDSPNWVREKTVYVGGFSKFDEVKLIPHEEKTIGILVGSGGTTITSEFILYLAQSVSNYFFKVIGEVETDQKRILALSAKVEFMGRLANPLEELQKCSLIIGNAGHNTVMEVASLQKRFICIPEERPFNEQLDKANRWRIHYGVNVILPENLMLTDWQYLLDQTHNQAIDWKGIINADATKLIRTEIDSLATQFFR